MNIKTTLKATVAAGAILAAAPAFAGEVTDGNQGLAIGGSLNWGVVHADNGDDSATTIRDMGSSINFTAKAPINETLTAGAYLNLEVQTNRNDGMGISQELNGTAANEDADSTASGNTVDIDRSNVSFAHSGAGTLTIGKHSEAADGIFSGNAGSGISNSNLRFHVSSTEGTYSAADMDSYTVGADGGDGYVVRYDSPNFAGAVVSVSHESQQGMDLAVRYSNTFGDFGVGVNAAYRALSGGSATNDDAVLFNVKLSHVNGFAIDGRYGKVDKIAAGDNADEVWGIGLGYTAALTDLGSTSFTAGYNVHEETFANGSEMTGYGLGVSQSIDAAGASVYAKYGNAELDTTTAETYDDIMTFVVGASVSF